MNYRELDSLILYEFLKNFSLSLIGIFIPIYILSEGMGLLSAALFIIISGVCGLVLSYPISRVIAKLGFKHSLIASYLFLIPGLIVIQTMELSIAVIVVSSVLYNFGRLLHRMGLESEFAIDSDRKKRTEDSGKMLSLPNISRIVAPFAGGVIFTGLGFSQLMLFALIIIFLSAVPLILSKDHHDPMDYDMKKLVSKESLKTLPLFIIRGVQAITEVDIFAVFVFLVVGGSIEVGSARALNSLGFVLTGLLIGYFASKIDKKLFVTVGCIGTSLVFFVRGFIATPLQAFVVSFLGGIFFQIYHVPLFSSFTDEAEDTEVLEFNTLRRIFYSVGQILAVSVLVLFYFFYDLSTGFIAVFVLGGIATLAMAGFYCTSE